MSRRLRWHPVENASVVCAKPYVLDVAAFELVERLAVTTWRLRRIPAFEAALIEARRAEATRYSLDADEETTGLALICDSQRQDTLGKLSRYEAALLNVFNRTLHQLMLIQDREAREIEGDPVVQIPPALTPPPSVNGGLASLRT
jgi:hypothetical protein